MRQNALGHACRIATTRLRGRGNCSRHDLQESSQFAALSGSPSEEAVRGSSNLGRMPIALGIESMLRFALARIGAGKNVCIFSLSLLLARCTC
jgi:hypothetical protein